MLGVVSFAAVACGGDQEPETQQREPGQKITLTFWSWVPGVDKAVDLWNSENPEVQVKLEKIPAGNQGGYAKMHSALKSGEAPDLAQVEYQVIPEFLLEDGLVDLAPLGVGDHEGDFVEWQWQQGAFGDGVYAVPQASGPMAMFYRADLFEKWGIAPPTTWAEYEQAARRIRQADPNAYISTFPPGNSAWFTSLAAQAGARWFDISGDTWQVDMDTPETIEVAEYWDRMRQDGLVKTDPDLQNGWYADLQAGRIVTWVGAQWGDAILMGNAPETAGKWRVAPIPQWSEGEQRSANWGGSSTALLKGASYPEEALKFALWLNTDPESIDLLIAGGYGWPAAKGAFSGSALDKPYEFFSGQKINEVFAEADQNIDKSWKWIPTTTAMYENLNQGFRAAVAGQGSFADSVRAAQTKTVADLKAKGLRVSEG
ncbi:extracellular solute-binding protein [Actinophytocola sp. S1-96]|uniref:Extracellular solute-binding protein n=2 Tax=Actinophytocola gossypii TaxID=2812003 RepID=A0ABT2J6T9_9PSEU|nr:extracellular solute-binding protein [Actinophytocola gossypii]